MDLSKPYGCISHELLVAKLEFYGLDELILDYLSNRKQRTKIGSSFSYWFDIFVGVPQGSILGLLLFNIFINDLFFMIIRSDVCNFADDKTLYSCDKKLENIFVNLKIDLKNVLYWFQVNSLKANPGKFQFMVPGDKKNNTFVLNIHDNEIKNSSENELLGITINSQLKFKKHIDNFCRKASCKLHALRRIRSFLTVEKAKMLANAFINSQFNYASLVWMFAGKFSINKICKIHYRTLQVIHIDYQKSYDELLDINKDVNIHQKHLRILVLEVFKSITHVNPEFMWSYFNEDTIPYNLRDGNRLLLPPAKSVKFEINSLIFRGSLLWNYLPLNLKSCQTNDEFKLELKRLGRIHCTCTACR